MIIYDRSWSFETTYWETMRRPISPAGSFLIVQYHSVARLQEIERRVHAERGSCSAIPAGKKTNQTADWLPTRTSPHWEALQLHSEGS